MSTPVIHERLVDCLVHVGVPDLDLRMQVLCSFTHTPIEEGRRGVVKGCEADALTEVAHWQCTQCVIVVDTCDKINAYCLRCASLSIRRTVNSFP